MAAVYAALVSLFNNLEDIQNHHRHSFTFDNNQIQSLRGSVTFLIEFMESYDNCYGPSKEAVQLLERRITRAAHAAEEVIESHVVNQIRSGSTLDGKTRSPRFLLDLEKVTGDMDYVRRKAIKVQQARSGLEVRQPTYSTSASSSTPFTSEKTTMVGFDDLLLQLLDLLTGYPSSRRVIPIVGTGGVGKTTLAQNAFESSLIVQYFDVCLWATISQQYFVQDILLTLLSRKGESNSETIDELEEQLHKRLYGRRYLIVLDDMWSVRAWDEMKFLFPDTNEGSRIVVTTRLLDVAHHIGSSSPLIVSLLDYDKSWNQFCQKVFAEQGCPPELENVAKYMVRKCKGLPLAIIVVAGHLGKSSRRQECWENVAKNMKSILNSEENKEFLDILSFSYNHLPIHLKPCFVYMGTFPEGKHIFVRDLIGHWIAEGFLKRCKTADNIEDIAKEYLKDLIDRNLILDGTSIQGSYCKIHDILRELCLEVAENEKFFYVLDTGRAICRERRVGIKEKNYEDNHHPEIVDAPRSIPLVRTFKWETSEQLFDLRFCRVLHKYGEVLAKVDLRHINLRYLRYYKNYRSDVSGLSLYLPASILQFWNLQTLIIGGNSSSFIAPNEIWEMIQLRHLQVQGRIYLPDPLPSDKLNKEKELVMRNLHTLWGVNNLNLNEEVCKRVPNIRALRVEYSDEVRSYYCPHNLRCLRKLESLVLRIFTHDSKCREFALSLAFPSSLKKLSLRNSYLDWDEMSMMVGSLPHLETLCLNPNSVMGSNWTLVEGKFNCLKTLTISYCDDLVYWNADNSHFPVLEDLVLEGLSKLDEVPSDIGAIPTLRSVTMVGCSVSSAISAVRMLVEQEEHGNEGLTLHVDFLRENEKINSFNKKVVEEDLRSNNLFLSKY